MIEDPSILVVGHATHDRFDDELMLGGCAYYAGQAYRRFGAGVSVATTVGEDFAFDEELFEAVTPLVRRSGRTTLFTNLYPDSSRRVQLLEASAPEVSPAEEVPEMVDLLHLAPVFGEVCLEDWTERVVAKLVAISVQGWLRGLGDCRGRAHAKEVVSRRWTPRPETLSRVGAASLSEDDLLGQEGLMDLLIEHVPVVALTRGRAGCDVYVGGICRHVGTYSTNEIDPTGAGDVFAAGFFHGLIRGCDPIEAARFGAAAASIVIEDVGGRALKRLVETPARLRAVGIDQSPCLSRNR